MLLDKTIKIFSKICMKKNFFFPEDETLLFFSTNMAAVMSAENQQ